MAKKKVIRQDFIIGLVQAGFTHAQATLAYSTMMSELERAVSNGSKVNLGKLGVLQPYVKEARKVHMGFKRTKAGVKKTQREYHVGRRLTYRFRIHKAWRENNQLDWLDT